jgi:hypothetical protein
MLSPIYFNKITYGAILGNSLCNVTPITRWLTFGKLPESPVVTPNTTTQVITASSANKYLESVTVNPIPTTPGA